MDPTLPFPDVLQLPSGLRLRVNLTYPRLKEVDGAKKLAVCSHPWSRLGGSMSDPYVDCAMHVTTLTYACYNLQRPCITGRAVVAAGVSRPAFQRARCRRLLRLGVLDCLPGRKGSGGTRLLYDRGAWRYSRCRAYCVCCISSTNAREFLTYSCRGIRTDVCPLPSIRFIHNLYERHISLYRIPWMCGAG